MRRVTVRGGQVLSGSTMLMLLAAGGALLAISAYAPKPAPDTAPVAVIAAVGLTDDSGGQSLFRSSGMVPGRAVSRCLRVSYAGPVGGTVYVAADDITGPLADSLRITVEQGTGGDSTTCTGFTSDNTVFDGNLPDLTDPDPAAPRTSTGWQPAASDSRTYRITATLPDDFTAQGRRSTATFRWFVFGLPPQPAGQSESPGPPAPSAVPADDRDVNPAVVVPVPRQRADTAQSDRAVAEEKPITTRLREALAKLREDLTEVAVRTSTHGALPIAGFAVLLAFLALQNRIDRLDPKLALAPMRDPHLFFNAPEPDDAPTPIAPPPTAPTPTAPHEEDA